MIDMSDLSTILIYFKHLTPCKQQELLKAYRIGGPEKMNWDVFPLFEMPVPDDNEINNDE